MAAIKTVGESQGWFYLLPARPTNPEAITLTELAAGIEGTWDAAASGTRFSFTASDTMSDAAYGDSSNSTITTRSNYEGSIAPFIKLDDTTGAYAALSNDLFEAVREKGAPCYVVSGITGDPTEARAAGDLYDYFEYTTDDGQKPTEVGGYMKRQVPLHPAGYSRGAKALVTA